MAKVLVVESDDGVRKLIAAVLRIAGHNVLTACSGDEAIVFAYVAHVYNKDVDLLISDVYVPNANRQPTAKMVDRAVMELDAPPDSPNILAGQIPRSSVDDAMCVVMKPYSGSFMLSASDVSAPDSIYRRAMNGVDWLLLDLSAPGCDAQQIAAGVKKFHSNVKVLFTSGGVQNDAMLKCIEEGTVNFMSKPFLLDDFRRKTDEILESA